jgi:type I restriction enzyme S subunit
VPNFEEQQKIAAVLSAADVEISTLEKNSPA